jgi:hypothetical protein
MEDFSRINVRSKEAISFVVYNLAKMFFIFWGIHPAAGAPPSIAYFGRAARAILNQQSIDLSPKKSRR